MDREIKKNRREFLRKITKGLSSRNTERVKRLIQGTNLGEVRDFQEEVIELVLLTALRNDNTELLDYITSYAPGIAVSVDWKDPRLSDGMVMYMLRFMVDQDCQPNMWIDAVEPLLESDSVLDDSKLRYAIFLNRVAYNDFDRVNFILDHYSLSQGQLDIAVDIANFQQNDNIVKLLVMFGAKAIVVIDKDKQN